MKEVYINESQLNTIVAAIKEGFGLVAQTAREQRAGAQKAKANGETEMSGEIFPSEEDGGTCGQKGYVELSNLVTSLKKKNIDAGGIMDALKIPVERVGAKNGDVRLCVAHADADRIFAYYGFKRRTRTIK